MLTSAGRLLFASVILPVRALCCSCGPPPPPCQAVGQSELVFLGTATEVLAPVNRIQSSHLTIDRVYKGELGKTSNVFYDGCCDAPEMEAGHQYLLYTSRMPDGRIPIGGCTRSRRVEQADEDLAFLKDYSAGKTTAHIDGTVYNETDHSRLPLRDVQITAASQGQTLHGTTDSLGQFSFADPPPGTYALSLDRAGYRITYPQVKIAVAPKSCAQVTLFMRVDRRVEGTIRDDLGNPQSNVFVEIVPRSSEHRSVLAVSDKSGRYVFDALDPGEYHLGVNIESVATKEQPFPAAYYPSMLDIKSATPIFVNEAATVQEFDLKLPPKLQIVTVRGHVQTKGETPLPAYTSVMINGLHGYQTVARAELSSDGAFEFELCEGVEYKASAFSGPPALMDADPIIFTATKEQPELLLILKQTATP